MSSSTGFAPAMRTCSWRGRNDGSVVRTSSPGSRRARIATYTPSIPPVVTGRAGAERRARREPPAPRLEGGPHRNVPPLDPAVRHGDVGVGRAEVLPDRVRDARGPRRGRAEHAPP